MSYLVVWSDVGAPFQLVFSPLISARLKCFCDDSERQAMRRTELFRFEISRMCENSCFCSFSGPSAMAVAVLSLAGFRTYLCLSQKIHSVGAWCIFVTMLTYCPPIM
jgi:hypothetical protein